MADAKEPVQSVQVFGRKKTATAVAYCKRGKGLIKVTFKVITKVKIKCWQWSIGPFQNTSCWQRILLKINTEEELLPGSLLNFVPYLI